MREQLKSTFLNPVVQPSIDIDTDVLAHYTKQLSKLEWYIEQQHNPVHYQLLKTISGVDRILALTIIYKIGDITRFRSVQKFASYVRLVKCKTESAVKTYGTSGNKIEKAIVLHLRGDKEAQNYLQKLQRRMSKTKALSAFAHKLGRCVFCMLKNETVFDERKFLKR